MTSYKASLDEDKLAIELVKKEGEKIEEIIINDTLPKTGKRQVLETVSESEVDESSPSKVSKIGGSSLHTELALIADKNNADHDMTALGSCGADNETGVEDLA